MINIIVFLISPVISDYQSTITFADESKADQCMQSLHPCIYPEVNCDNAIFDFAVSLQVTISQILTAFDKNYLDGAGTTRIFPGVQTGILKPSLYSVSSSYDFAPGAAMEFMKYVYDGGVRCKDPLDANNWYQFGSSIPHLFHRIGIKGRTNLYNEYISTLKISYTLDGINYIPYQGGQIFIGVQTFYKTNYIELTPFVARAIRLIPITVAVNGGGRFEVFISSHEYRNYLPSGSLIAAISCGFNVDVSGTYGVGYEELNIPIGFSSGTSQSWCAGFTNVNQWAGVSASVPMQWKIISSQGSKNLANWVTSYKVNYTVDGLNWISYNNGAVFNANTNQDTVVNLTLTPFVALGIRVNPVTWNGNLICMRLEFYCSETGGFWS